MRVPGYDDLESGCRRIEIQFRQVVEDVNQDGADLKDLGFGDRFRPGTSVVVATDGGDGRQRPQGL